MVEIDGSFGEGGGQILRTSLSLSCLSGKPFRLHNIRRGRKKPGLMPQHLTCVRAAALVSDAAVEGDSRGSLELSFSPGRVRPGHYGFDIGTAGSTSLVLQCLLPPLLFAGGESTLTLTGGTHVPFSPPFHYVSEVFIPLLARLGARARAEIDSYGFYPRGGGKVRVAVRPCAALSPAVLTERGELLRLSGVSAVGGLPPSIARRQTDSLLRALGEITADVETAEVDTPGRGTFVFLRAEFENTVAGFSALGARGKRAEDVGEEAAREFLSFLGSGACLDHHMADQMSLYLALADGRSSFTASAITEHLRTNIHVLEKFLDIRFEIGLHNTVTIEGRSPSGAA